MEIVSRFQLKPKHSGGDLKGTNELRTKRMLHSNLTIRNLYRIVSCNNLVLTLWISSTV